LIYRLKRMWSDGSTDVIFEPQDFMSKLAALVPAPRVHLPRFHGILAPAARWRPLIVPKPAGGAALPSVLNPELAPAPEMDIPPNRDAIVKSTPARRNYAWALLMMRVFLLDVLQCECCGGRMKILAAIHPPDTTAKILECLGLPSRAPPLAPAVSDFNYPMDSF
jgi:hypothetical protein